MRLVEQRERHAEAGVGGLGAGDRLEDQIDRHAAPDRRERRRHVRQHAGLGRDAVFVDHRIEQMQQPGDLRQVVGGRVDADHRVAAAVEQAVEQGGGDAGGIVGRVVRLQPRRQPPGQADGVAKARDHAALARDDDQILHAHQLADRGDHLRRQPRRERGERAGIGLRRQQPVAEITDRQVRDRREGRGIVAVEDQARDLVILVRDHGLVQEGRERQLGERVLRGDALLGRFRGEAGEHVAGAQRRGLGEQVLQVREAVARGAEGVGVGHRETPRGGCTVAHARVLLPPVSPHQATPSTRFMPAGTRHRCAREHTSTGPGSADGAGQWQGRGEQAHPPSRGRGWGEGARSGRSAGVSPSPPAPLPQGERGDRRPGVGGRSIRPAESLTRVDTGEGERAEKTGCSAVSGITP